MVDAFLRQVLEDMRMVRDNASYELEVRIGLIGDEHFRPGISPATVFDRAYDVLKQSQMFQSLTAQVEMVAIAFDARRRIEWSNNGADNKTHVRAVHKRVLRKHVDLPCRPLYPFDIRLALSEETVSNDIADDDQQRPIETVRLRRSMRLQAWRLDWTVRFDGPGATTLNHMNVEVEYDPKNVKQTTTVHNDLDELQSILYILAQAMNVTNTL